MSEQFKISLIVGNRGTGKTGTLIRKILPGYIVRRAIAKKDIRVAIVDLEKNYNYEAFECLKDPSYPAPRKELLRRYVKQPVPVITRAQLPGLVSGVVRVLPGEEPAGDFAGEVFNQICYDTKIHNCLVAIEDSARFMPDNNRLDTDLRNMIINSKQRAMDIVFMFHYWSDVPPKLLRWIDHVYLHKCDESVKLREKLISENKVTMILDAERKLKSINNRYHSELIILNN